MKKLSVIFLPAVLSVMLTSCAWLYQVTGVECYVTASGETGSAPAVTKVPDATTADTEN